MINTDSFAALTDSEKMSMVNSLLVSLTEIDENLGYALIQKNSINYYTEWNVFELKYACGVNGIIDLPDYEDTDNGTEIQVEFKIQEEIISSADGIYGTALLMNGFERRTFRDD